MVLANKFAFFHVINTPNGIGFRIVSISQIRKIKD